MVCTPLSDLPYLVPTLHPYGVHPVVRPSLPSPYPPSLWCASRCPTFLTYSLPSVIMVCTPLSGLPYLLPTLRHNGVHPVVGPTLPTPYPPSLWCAPRCRAFPTYSLPSVIMVSTPLSGLPYLLPTLHHYGVHPVVGPSLPTPYPPSLWCASRCRAFPTYLKQLTTEALPTVTFPYNST